MFLVERDDELRILRDLLAECADGRGRVVVVSGGAAVGKTELVNAVTEEALDAGAVVLAATGSRAERCLPFGFLHQLLQGIPADTGGIARLLAAHAGGPETGGGDVIPQEHAQIAHEVCSLLFAAARQQPVILTLDDLNHADTASLRCVLFLLRRLRSARVMVIVTEGESSTPSYLHFRAELLRQPYCQRVRLFPFTPAGVMRRLAAELGEEATNETTPTYFAASGGNPLLLNALIEGYRAARRELPTGVSPEPVVGDGYRQAVLACLYRCEPPVAEVAAGLAVLHEAATPSMLHRLLDLEPEAVIQAIQTLNMAGLLERGRLRHAAARAAVLENLPATERTELHVRAAWLLRADQGEPVTIARLLLAVGWDQDPAVVPILEEAAEAALAVDDSGLAVRCLELAQLACSGQRRRAVVTLRLVEALWLVAPADAARHLAGLVDLAELDLLEQTDQLSLLSCLLWFGRVDEANRLLLRWDVSVPGRDGQITLVRHQLLASFPQLLARLPAAPRVAELGTSPNGLRPTPSAAAVLARALANGNTDQIVLAAEEVLQATRLSAANLEAIEFALMALVYADRADRAAHYCVPLLGEATSREVPTWRAVLSLVSAEIALRHGDLTEADEHAAAALTHVGVQGLGVRARSAQGIRVLALTEMGEHSAAAEVLRLPVPELMLRSRYSLPYLLARGVHFLATDRPQAAEADFRSCGSLMTQWGTDAPALIPWRSELAQVQVRLGAREQARELAEQQLGRSAGLRRARGISLRVLASTVELRQRPGLLRQAADILQACGDRLELAKTLAELSRTHYALGEFYRARMMVRRAVHLAQQCHAERTVCGDLLSLARESLPSDTKSATEVKGLAQLSEAERRVAALAARGHTNREIGRKLFITVSTVEQHLTRVYRKLKVNSRADLLVWESTEKPKARIC
ncbi:LuxR family transcriptional regulator [Allokutzneria sp. NRRL B-24872]|uniref:helix-turn-helix transcriptional regulator n=1 Tax=Allokutzneria sp. NRRL B-24872 TaxID=1137961 RepID=UPI000A366FA1|nr:LuxR family transcriptional regulator [Allokutzneria sp. NRRL B-24872]